MSQQGPARQSLLPQHPTNLQIACKPHAILNLVAASVMHCCNHTDLRYSASHINTNNTQFHTQTTPTPHPHSCNCGVARMHKYHISTALRAVGQQCFTIRQCRAAPYARCSRSCSSFSLIPWLITRFTCSKHVDDASTTGTPDGIKQGQAVSE